MVFHFSEEFNNEKNRATCQAFVDLVYEMRSLEDIEKLSQFFDMTFKIRIKNFEVDDMFRRAEEVPNPLPPVSET